MGGRMRDFDWSSNPLGPPERWSQSLKTTVRIMLTSRQAMWCGWGKDLLFLYNDAYKAILGGRHPAALAQPTSIIWWEIWGDIESRLARVMSGNEGTYDEAKLLIMERNGYAEETYVTFSYSPIPNDAGEAGGVFCANTEVTERVMGERQLALLRELAANTSVARTWQDACERSVNALLANPRDLPFAIIYMAEPDGSSATLAGACGVKRGQRGVPEKIAREDSSIWPIWDVLESRSNRALSGLEAIFGDTLPMSVFQRTPTQAVALPIYSTGETGRAGVLIVGLNPLRLFDDNYQGFLSLVAGQISASVANAEAYEEEKKRVDALAQLDRAKTAFFSNVSHEFRTPLTLMLGPIEDLLARAHTDLSPAATAQLELANRNGMRLMRLVNSLLDFSRIESGRVRAHFQRTDLATFTGELASVFRSMCERAGLILNVDCAPFSEPVYVDSEMWEKVVLNLLSNAFKFTFDGEITVTLRQVGRTAELRVKDTGTGIPADEMPRLFERFHRVENAHGRTHEGSGIGLALVQELVKLHNGTVTATSAMGRGTTFIVQVPLGSAHLPQNQVGKSRTEYSEITSATPYVEEALRWLPDADAVDESQNEIPKQFKALRLSYAPATSTEKTDRPRVVVADDNADMRQYIARLLAPNYEVELTANGVEALAAVRRRLPELVLTDVMMPQLHGFGLLRELRASPQTKSVPVIMLSARAGEESKVDGMEAGADDYIVKPFSAKELLARVAAHIQMARVRKEADQAIRISEEKLRSIFDGTHEYIGLLTPDGKLLEANRASLEFAGNKREEVVGVPFWETPWFAYTPGASEQIQKSVMKAAAGEFVRFEAPIRNPAGFELVFDISFYPICNEKGEVILIVPEGRDITELKRAEAVLRASDAQFKTLLDNAPLGVYLLDADLKIRQINPTTQKAFGDVADLIGRDFDEIIHLLWPKDYADEVVKHFRHTLASGQPYYTPERIEQRMDRGVVEYYEWWINRIPLPDGSYGVVCYFRDISEQVRAREAIKALNNKFAEHLRIVDRVLSSITDFAYTFDLEGRFTFVNKPLLDLWNLPLSHAVGKNFFDLNYPPELAEKMQRQIQQVIQTGITLSDETPYTGANGEEGFYQYIFSPVVGPDGKIDAVAGSTRDVTERKKNEEALRNSEERYRTLFNAMDQGFCVIEMLYDERGEPNDYRFLEVNPAFEKHTGLVNASGRRIREFAPNHETHWFETYGKIAATGDGMRFVNVALELRQRWYDVYSFRLGGPESRRIAIFFSDITEHRRNEEQRRDADRRKDDFLATLAHELRNPLAPLRTGLQVMKLSANNAEVIEQNREMMERQLAQMVRLIDDLLDISRISRGKIELQKQPLELATILRNGIETARPMIDQAGHRLKVQIPLESIVVFGDAIRLSQIFSNLLNNAAKFTERGGQISLNAEREGDSAVVRIKDNGIGIPTHVLTDIFEMFMQLDRSLDKSQGGLGVGLSLVRGLVQMHGGRVEARSEGVGKGSEFIVRLPLQQTGTLVAPEKNIPAETTPSESGRRILVVDDNRDNTEALALLLQLAGYKTAVALDGSKALEMVESWRPDIVLLDIGMPQLDGYEVCRRIRQQPRGKEIVLIAQTGWGAETDRQRTKEAGFDAHLVKPVDPDVLVDMCAKLNLAKK